MFINVHVSVCCVNVHTDIGRGIARCSSVWVTSVCVCLWHWRCYYRGIRSEDCSVSHQQLPEYRSFLSTHHSYTLFTEDTRLMCWVLTVSACNGGCSTFTVFKQTVWRVSLVRHTCSCTVYTQKYSQTYCSSLWSHATCALNMLCKLHSSPRRHIIPGKSYLLILAFIWIGGPGNNLNLAVFAHGWSVLQPAFCCCCRLLHHDEQCWG